MTESNFETDNQKGGAMRTLLITLVFIGIGLLLTFCNRKPNLAPSSEFLNLADSVEYVGMQTCRSCHPKIYDSFIQTGMGQSFDTASLSKTAAKFEDHHLVYDSISQYFYRPFFKDSIFYIEEFRLTGKDTTHKRLEKVDYIIGSGQHTNSHILSFGGYIYQAPITYYTQEQKWDMAPGFESKNLRFSRLLNTECITCHNHLPDHAAGSQNKFTEMPTGIECERCHGPGEIHRREKLAGNIVDTSTSVDYTIVNPRHLSRDLQMDLCQRCHLQGVAVLNSGKTFFDFKPGMKLNSVMEVYLPRYTNSHEKFIMASQADRLRMSPCYQSSETLTCITCHNPHQSVSITGSEKFNDACINCHEDQQQACLVDQAKFDAADGNCVSCHMPRSGSIDIPHVNITDHNISRQTALRVDQPSETKSNSVAQFLGLTSLTSENPSDLKMAQGYLALYDKYVQAPAILDSAKVYLNRSSEPAAKKLKTQIHYFFNIEDYESLIKYYTQNKTNSLEDWTAYRIGQAYLALGQPEAALELLNQAVNLSPLNLEFLEKNSVALLQVGRTSEAQTTLEFVLAENPKRKLALSNLGYILASQGKVEQAEFFYDRAIALDPDYEQALINKAAVRMFKNDLKVAEQLLRRVLEVNPENGQAREGLERMGIVF